MRIPSVPLIDSPFSFHALSSRRQRLGPSSSRMAWVSAGWVTSFPCTLGTAEVSPLEIATVYATFANGGLRPTPRSFIGLLDEHGVAQEQWPLAGARRVLDPGTAYLTTSLLEGVVDRGTGAGIRARGL